MHSRGSRSTGRTSASARASSDRRGNRARKRRLHPVETALIACFALAIVAAAATYTRPAEMPQGPVATVRVAPQQTLWEIAEQHPVEGHSTSETVQIILTMNDLDTAALAVGQSIVVPHLAPLEGASVASR